MYFQEYQGINSFLVGAARFLLESGVKRNVRGLLAYEIDHPIIFKINNPLARIVTIDSREWNHVLPYAESLWLATGRNDMEFIGAYLKRMYDFSDDLQSMRAGYGPRLRYFNGISDDYKTAFDNKKLSSHAAQIEIDQFKFVTKSFLKDPYTRQAVITITDPAKDFFQHNGLLKPTKDFPCTNNIQFIRKGNQLDLITNMRSNDFLWGASAVNIFNFTFIQEYFAQILGLDVGHYYHIVNNFHYYSNFKRKVEAIANENEYVDDYYNYKKAFSSLEDFDLSVSRLESFEKQLRENTNTQLIEFEDDFFNDWAKVLYRFHTKDNRIEFKNHLLNKIQVKRTSRGSYYKI